MVARLPLYLTADYPCSYLPGRRARNLVAEPARIDHQGYQQLLRQGFRRSGDHVYRPHCHGCNACQSLRVSSHHFRPSRSQRRTWNRNNDLHLKLRRLTPDEEHYRLFRRYVGDRHPGGGMDSISPDAFFEFTASTWCDSRLWELRDADGRLLCGAVIDHLEDGYSAVYSYFEPSAAYRSPGTLIILLQLARARDAGLPWVYLGYYIGNCTKMAYKKQFRPHQRFLGGEWHWQE